MSANIHLPPRASSARGRVVRDKIMCAAYRLFVERGFDGVSIEQIADAAGLSRRTIYNKFASKTEIYRVAFEPALARLQLAASVSPSSSNDPQDVLRHYTSAACALLRCPELIEVLRVLVYDSDRQPWLAQAYVDRVRRPIRSRFADEITRLVTLGALPHHDVHILTERFFATLLGLLAFPRLLQLDAGDGDAAAAEFMRASVESLLGARQESEFSDGAREASRSAGLPPRLPDQRGTCRSRREASLSSASRPAPMSSECEPPTRI
jgi:AcrR family transcriptional regulator